jgi:hypothetical protein
MKRLPLKPVTYNLQPPLTDKCQTFNQLASPLTLLQKHRNAKPYVGLPLCQTLGKLDNQGLQELNLSRFKLKITFRHGLFFNVVYAKATLDVIL